jgi:3-hydroxymyristoyl/3-hydroxydecanoyl-(acyl carrier protein) dehydratase
MGCSADFRQPVLATARCATHPFARMAFSIDPSHPSLPGHFPGAPVVPGVLVLEQVLAAIEAAHGPPGALRLPQVKFVRPLLPGERAEVVIEGEAPRWRFRVLHDGAVVAGGEVVAA